MTNDGYMSADEMKRLLRLKTETDNRTLNKYVVQGKLEVKPFSNKVKLYRLPQNDNSTETFDNEEWIFAKQVRK